MSNDIKEPGAASLLIELQHGVISVTHGTDKIVLKQWTANTGDWMRLWRHLCDLQDAAEPQPTTEWPDQLNGKEDGHE